MNRQFDVVTNPESKRRPKAPFMIVLQSHHLPMQTTIIAPIRLMEDTEGLSEVEVPVSVHDTCYAVMVSELAHLPTHMVGRTIDNLAGYEDDLRRALDRLFTGF